MGRPRKPKPDETTKTYKPQTEWLRNRLLECGYSRSTAAKAIGTYATMVDRILTGSRPIRPEEIIQFAKLLDLTIAETLTRFGYDAPPRLRAPIIGRVDNRGRVTLARAEDRSSVDAPTDSDKGLEAVVIDAPGSPIAYLDGAILYFRPAETIEATGRLSFMCFHGSATPFVGVPTKVLGAGYRISTLGNTESKIVEDLKSAAPIIWILNS